MADKTPNFWRKLEILLAPVGGLLTAITVAAIGASGAYLLNKKQEIDARSKVFTELTSQREQAETVMRKDMFAQIIESILKPEKSSHDLTVLNMELLAYNFHESLNLKPLFSYVQRHLDPISDKQYLERLEKVAKDVTRKQLLVLEEGGQKSDRTIDLNALSRSPAGIVMEPMDLTVGGIQRRFELTALTADVANHRLEIQLQIITDGDTETVPFTIGFYDFPMIDNTRLSADQRCAVVLNNFCEDPSCAADVTLVFFPGSRASLQERAFTEDVIRQLQAPSDGRMTK
jgi:hypothetical protein